MFYNIRRVIQWSFASFITIVGFSVWFYLYVFWIMVKWVHGLFYKRKHGYKPYNKITDNVPTCPKFGKLFKLPPKPKKSKGMCFEEYVLDGHFERR